MAKQKSWKGKKQYKVYQTENRVFYNKVRKLERHCKNHPNDELGKENLVKIKKKGYTGRKRPNEPGSNRIRPIIISPISKLPETAGEQLARLLGIALPKFKPKTKPKIIRKKKRNVKT